MHTPPPTQHCSWCLRQQFCGLDSQGFLNRAGWTWRTLGHFPSSGPRGHTAAWGGGCARKAGLVLNKRLGAGQLHGWFTGAGSSHTHTGGLLHPRLCRQSWRVSGHPAAGSSLPPLKGLLHRHLVSRFRRAAPLPCTHPLADTQQPASCRQAAPEHS